MMKKILVTLILVLTGILALSSFVSAEADKITVVVDGEELSFDQDPVIIDGRTLVPLRGIFEKLGAEVLWDDDTKTVTAKKDDLTISLTVGQNVIFKNGNQIALDVPARIISSRTMVPARAVSECLDAKVGWEEVSRTVVISSDESLNTALLMLERCDDACFISDTEAEADGMTILMNIKVGIDLKNKLSLVKVSAKTEDYTFGYDYTVVTGEEKSFVDDNGNVTVGEGAGEHGITLLVNTNAIWKASGEDEEHKIYEEVVSGIEEDSIFLYASKITNEPKKLLIKNIPAQNDMTVDVEFLIVLNTGEIKAVFDSYNN